MSNIEMETDIFDDMRSLMDDPTEEITQELDLSFIKEEDPQEKIETKEAIQSVDNDIRREVETVVVFDAEATVLSPEAKEARRRMEKKYADIKGENSLDNMLANLTVEFQNERRRAEIDDTPPPTQQEFGFEVSRIVFDKKSDLKIMLSYEDWVQSIDTKIQEDTGIDFSLKMYEEPELEPAYAYIVPRGSANAVRVGAGD